MDVDEEVFIHNTRVETAEKLIDIRNCVMNNNLVKGQQLMKEMEERVNELDFIDFDEEMGNLSTKVHQNQNNNKDITSTTSGISSNLESGIHGVTFGNVKGQNNINKSIKGNVNSNLGNQNFGGALKKNVMVAGIRQTIFDGKKEIEDLQSMQNEMEDAKTRGDKKAMFMAQMKVKKQANATGKNMMTNIQCSMNEYYAPKSSTNACYQKRDCDGLKRKK